MHRALQRIPRRTTILRTRLPPTPPGPRPFRTSTMDAITHPDPSTLRITNHTQYASPTHLTPATVHASPLPQFDEWFTAAGAAGVPEPEAMSLATCTRAGTPSVRIVLLKQVDARGFVFYTNYTSRKSRELAETQRAALAFHWREVARQVRVVGRVERVSEAESAAYFCSRPVGSRVGAWASPQSTVVGEDELAQRVEDVRRKFGVQEGDAETDIPLPTFWGGWRIIPEEVEFWAGKPSRLHDRVRYLRVEGPSEDAPEWKIERLAP